tara:strand:+ start:63 stop:185 length:123 start_codon:yes stop_codon:yes gene_type:complete
MRPVELVDLVMATSQLAILLKSALISLAEPLRNVEEILKP